MSKERQRARAAREAAKAAEREKAARKRERRQQLERAATTTKAAVTPPKREPVYRQRRYPPLPRGLKIALAVFWLLVQVAAYIGLDRWGPRLAVLIVSTFALPLLVVLLRDPARRPRR